MADNIEKNGLTRKLGLFPITNIVVANMIGAGIFTTSGLLMQDLHNPMIMIILWVVGGTIAICGAFSCLLYTSPSPRDQRGSRMPSSA